MPPWHADRNYRSYANEKGLNQHQIDLISTWVQQGTPRGPQEHMPAIPEFPDGSQIGKPDMTLSVQQAFSVPGNNSEQFVLFVIPFEISEAKHVRAIEFVGGNMPLLHHANFGFYAVPPEIDIHGDLAPILADNMGPYVQRVQALSRNLVFYNGWIPGSSPFEFPPNTGFVLPKRGVVMLTMHYAPSAVPAKDSSALNIFFGEEREVRPVQTLSIGSAGIGTISPPLNIPPNKISHHRVQIKTNQSLSLLYVWPHMHLIGKSFTAYAVPPNGDTIRLVRIRQWDFNWQEAYQFSQIVSIPAGSIITVEGSYDNTADNPDNPFDPPRMIRSDGLMRTKNEMLSLILVYLEHEEGDEAGR